VRRDPLRVVIVVAALALAVWAARAAATRPTAGAGGGITEAQRRAGLHFAPDVAPADRRAVLAAIAGARPDARRLIGIVDGLVDLHVGPIGNGALGVTQSTATGYRVTLDLGTVAARYGPRGMARVTLHELGHVLDFALLPRALTARLDAGIPAGWGCEEGHSGACAPREERFAETFAKWATGDIGVDLYIGYKVPPPSPSLEAWGRPLQAFTG
jgi:hypothetical protein